MTIRWIKDFEKHFSDGSAIAAIRRRSGRWVFLSVIVLSFTGCGSEPGKPAIAQPQLEVVAPSSAPAASVVPVTQGQPVAEDNGYHFVPAESNKPVGAAKGIFPGRVVWAHNPAATRWKGNWKADSDQYWLDANTDQQLVEEMLIKTLTTLTGQKTAAAAWKDIFIYHNRVRYGQSNKGYTRGEIVVIKPNYNNSEKPDKVDNLSDSSPQLVLSMIRQLVTWAAVAPKNIVVVDARRFIPPYLLNKVWAEFPDVRFVQVEPAKPGQPKNPKYGDHTGLEGARPVKAIQYSKGEYERACNIPQQVLDAKYLINMAMLKAHSYPYSTMEEGDEGQTAISMCGKNHFGLIEGPWELHSLINPSEAAEKNAYSPFVDLASSPNLGAKTILFVLDGLYSGRRWRTYPVHFPNPPFNNAVEPYENPSWPASVLASFDGVALDCVGLDIYLSQTKNNTDESGHSRLLVRKNADDYLMEMAMAENPPSGTSYIQDGKKVMSLGVHEHWDSDESRKYSRNLNPQKGTGIELVYLPAE